MDKAETVSKSQGCKSLWKRRKNFNTKMSNPREIIKQIERQEEPKTEGRKELENLRTKRTE